MTKAELIKKLEKYPDDMEITVENGFGFYLDILDVTDIRDESNPNGISVIINTDDSPIDEYY